MGKYLIHATYKPDGVKGLLKEGGSSRRAAIEQLVRGLGGVLEVFYYAFGDADVYAIIDVPDNETAAALSLAVTATGLVGVKMTVLMTVEEADRATKKTVNYRPPGA